jgi:hypothetical protein
MVTKKAKRPTKRVGTLKNKSLSDKHAKRVKGGIIIIGGRLKTPANPTFEKWIV